MFLKSPTYININMYIKLTKSKHTCCAIIHIKYRNMQELLCFRKHEKCPLHDSHTNETSKSFLNYIKITNCVNYYFRSIYTYFDGNIMIYLY